jgi:hypothetical protein
MIDSGWVAAIATLVSALIIALTAVVAVRQLRHNRNANDITVYLRLIDTMDSPEMLAARDDLEKVRERIANDPTYLENLENPKFTPNDFGNVVKLLRYLEHISVLVTKGGVAEKLLLAEYADNMVYMWDAMRPAMLRRRIAFGPHLGRAFEHLAMRAKRYIDSGEMEREYNALERDPRDIGPSAQARAASTEAARPYPLATAHLDVLDTET